MENIYNAIQNVYNMDKTTWQEVLAELYNLVSNVENKFDLFENKFGPLLGEQVTIELKKMYDDGLLAEEVTRVLKKMNDDGSLAALIDDKLLKDINTKVDAFKTEVSEQLDTIANKGTSVDVIERVTKEEIDRQFAEGTIANLTIKDNSITNEKYKEKSISINKVDFINYSETITGNLIDETIFKGKKVSELQRFECPITSGDLRYYWKLTDTTGTLGNSHVVFFFEDNNKTRISNFISQASKATVKSVLNSDKTFNDVKYINFFKYPGSENLVIKSFEIIPTFFSDLNLKERKIFRSTQLDKISTLYEKSINWFDKTNIFKNVRVNKSNANPEVGTDSDFMHIIDLDLIPSDIDKSKLYTVMYDINNYNVLFFDENYNRLTFNYIDKRNKSFAITEGTRYILIFGTVTNLDKIMIGFEESIWYSKYVDYYKIKESCYDIQKVNQNYWFGKIGDSLGDSLTGQDGINFTGFQTCVKKYFGLKEYYNHGVGGSKMTTPDMDNTRPSMCQQSRIDLLNPNADFITVLGGQNDGESVQVGEISLTNTDTNTYAGAVNTVIRKIYKKYNSNILIILCTPFYVPAANEGEFLKAKELAECVRELANLWALPVCDFAQKSRLNEGVANIYWGTDRVHPLQECHIERLSPVLIQTLKENEQIDFNSII